MGIQEWLKHRTIVPQSSSFREQLYESYVNLFKGSPAPEVKSPGTSCQLGHETEPNLYKHEFPP